MDENYLRRKAISEPILEEDSALLRLLRDLFIEVDAPYCVKSLAADMGVSVFTVYKIFGADRPLRADALLAIIQFIHDKDAADTRLLDFICGYAGCMAVKKVAPGHDAALQAIMAQVADLSRGKK